MGTAIKMLLPYNRPLKGFSLLSLALIVKYLCFNDVRLPEESFAMSKNQSKNAGDEESNKLREAKIESTWVKSTIMQNTKPEISISNCYTVVCLQVFL